MRNTKFSFDGSTAFYIKLPDEDFRDELEIKIMVPEKLKGKYLALVVADENTNIPAKNFCSEEECNNCMVVYCPVYQEFARLKNVDYVEPNKEKDDRPVITGHENCRLGDCFESCNNVLCGIKAGASPIPIKPEDC